MVAKPSLIAGASAVVWADTRWSLSLAQASHVEAIVSNFRLELLDIEKPRCYAVKPLPGGTTPLWADCVLVERGEEEAPALLASEALQGNSSDNDFLRAGRLAKQAFEEVRHRASRLEADIVMNGIPASVTLFQVPHAIDNADPLLVVFVEDDQSEPDGSAVGRPL